MTPDVGKIINEAKQELADFGSVLLLESLRESTSAFVAFTLNYLTIGIKLLPKGLDPGVVIDHCIRSLIIEALEASPREAPSYSKYPPMRRGTSLNPSFRAMKQTLNREVRYNG